MGFGKRTVFNDIPRGVIGLIVGEKQEDINFIFGKMIVAADLLASVSVEVLNHFSGLDEADDILHLGTLLYCSLFNGAFLNYYCRCTEKSQGDKKRPSQSILRRSLERFLFMGCAFNSIVWITADIPEAVRKPPRSPRCG